MCGDTSPAGTAAGLTVGFHASGRHLEALSCYDHILKLKDVPSNVLADTLSARANALASLGRMDEPTQLFPQTVSEAR